MKAVMVLVILAFLALVFLAGASGDEFHSPAKLWHAWRNPVDPSLDSMTINAMYQLQGELTLLLLLVVPAGLGSLAALILFMLSASRKQ